jgi:methyl-accepting chemotaxis protein PixJ
MFKNLFNPGTDEESEEATAPASIPTQTEQMFNTTSPYPRATNNGSTKQQLLSAIQDAQFKLEASNTPSAEPLRQSLRKAKELAGFLTVPQASMDPELVHQIANKIRRAPDWNAALNLAITEIQTALTADRVSVYQLTDGKMGTIVAEVVKAGFTPALGDEIPQIGFGLEKLTNDRTQRSITLLDTQTNPISETNSRSLSSPIYSGDADPDY